MSIPRNEYPRPRLVRDQWINLNGEWDFKIDSVNSGYEQNFWETPFDKKIIVPFVPESKLSGIEYTDFMLAVWYRREIEIPADWMNQRILLHFGAVDYQCEVRVNNKCVGKHRGGYTPFTCDITDAVIAGKNTVVVYAYDDVKNNLQPTGKQSERYANYGCCYTRCTGIWQTVWMEAVPKTYIKNIKVTPDIDAAVLDVLVSFEGCSAAGITVTAVASFDGTDAGTAACSAHANYAHLTLPITGDLKLWEPGNPALYDLTITAGDDKIESYFGMRKVEINGYAIEINGKPIYQRLVLDQGYYPDGIYTAPNDEALRYDIELSMKAGFNGARMHMKVFEPRFSYWADKLGYLLWAEYPNWGLDESNPASLLAMLPEWLEAVERDYNSPAIVGWCPFNETRRSRRADVFTTVYEVTRAIDPMRPIIDTSGYVHAKTDIYDVHDYDQNPETFRERYLPLITGEGEIFVNHKGHEFYEGQPYFVSEFGGTSWYLDENDGSAWGYGSNPQSIEEFYTRFEGLVNVLLENPKMCAFCYTQLTDVYQEQNGMYAFDRRGKFDYDRINKILTQKAAIEK